MFSTRSAPLVRQHDVWRALALALALALATFATLVAAQFLPHTREYRWDLECGLASCGAINWEYGAWSGWTSGSGWISVSLAAAALLCLAGGAALGRRWLAGLAWAAALLATLVELAGLAFGSGGEECGTGWLELNCPPGRRTITGEVAWGYPVTLGATACLALVCLMVIVAARTSGYSSRR